MQALRRVKSTSLFRVGAVPVRHDWYSQWSQEKLRTPTKAQIHSENQASRILMKHGFPDPIENPVHTKNVASVEMNTQFTKIKIPETSDYPFPWDEDGHHRNAHNALVLLTGSKGHLDITPDELLNIGKGRKGPLPPAAVEAAYQVLDVWRGVQPQVGRWRDALHELVNYLIDIDELGMFLHPPQETDYEIRTRLNAGAYDDAKFGWHRFKRDCVQVYDNALTYYDPVNAKYHWTCALRYKEVAQAMSMPARPSDPKVRALAAMQAQRLSFALKDSHRVKVTGPGEESFSPLEYESAEDFARATSLAHMEVSTRLRALAAVLVGCLVGVVVPLLVTPDATVLLFGEEVLTGNAEALGEALATQTAGGTTSSAPAAVEAGTSPTTTTSPAAGSVTPPPGGAPSSSLAASATTPSSSPTPPATSTATSPAPSAPSAPTHSPSSSPDVGVVRAAGRILSCLSSHPVAVAFFLLSHTVLAIQALPIAITLVSSAVGTRRYGAIVAQRVFGKTMPHKVHQWVQIQSLPTKNMAPNLTGRTVGGRIGKGAPGPGAW